MAATEKRTRLSKDKQVEYQIEIKKSGWFGLAGEYRVRRGACGTWTKWFQTQNTYNLLANLGFDRKTPTFLNDFYFESYFGRGKIQINFQIYKVIAGTNGNEELNAHLYSRIKQLSPTRWIIPASALETKDIFDYTKNLIRKNNS